MKQGHEIKSVVGLMNNDSSRSEGATWKIDFLSTLLYIITNLIQFEMGTNERHYRRREQKQEMRLLYKDYCETSHLLTMASIRLSGS